MPMGNATSNLFSDVFLEIYQIKIWNKCFHCFWNSYVACKGNWMKSVLKIQTRDFSWYKKFSVVVQKKVVLRRNVVGFSYWMRNYSFLLYSWVSPVSSNGSEVLLKCGSSWEKRSSDYFIPEALDLSIVVLCRSLGVRKVHFQQHWTLQILG